MTSLKAIFIIGVCCTLGQCMRRSFRVRRQTTNPSTTNVPAQGSGTVGTSVSGTPVNQNSGASVNQVSGTPVNLDLVKFLLQAQNNIQAPNSGNIPTNGAVTLNYQQQYQQLLNYLMMMMYRTYVSGMRNNYRSPFGNGVVTAADGRDATIVTGLGPVTVDGNDVSYDFW